jgi:hypothetical protein
MEKKKRDEGSSNQNIREKIMKEMKTPVTNKAIGEKKTKTKTKTKIETKTKTKTQNPKPKTIVLIHWITNLGNKLRPFYLRRRIEQAAIHGTGQGELHFRHR